MNFMRCQKEQSIFYGILEDERVIVLEGSIYDGYHKSDKSYPVRDVKILSPCEPSKVICIGLNYRDHAEELGLPIPESPVVFMKPSTAVIGPSDQIIYPADFVTRLDHEAELGVVIGKRAKNIPEAEAMDYVLGLTNANDVTARNLQQKDGQWTIAKSFDTFIPLGPVINTDISWDNLDIKCYLNGEVKQSSNTKNLIFGVPYLVSYLSRVMTLLPGDVIVTGTPSGISPMQPGDVVTVEISGIGALTNQVAKPE